MWPTPNLICCVARKPACKHVTSSASMLPAGQHECTAAETFSAMFSCLFAGPWLQFGCAAGVSTPTWAPGSPLLTSLRVVDLGENPGLSAPDISAYGVVPLWEL